MPINQPSPAFLSHNIEKSLVINTSLHFLLSPPVASFRINLPLRVPITAIPIDSNPCKFLNQNQHILPRPNSSIASSEGIEAILLAACQLVEAIEKEGFESTPVDLYSEKEDNDTFFNQCSSNNKSFPKEGDSSKKDE